MTIEILQISISFCILNYFVVLQLLPYTN